VRVAVVWCCTGISFFDNVERIGKADFRPNQEDILRARFRTSGIVEKTFMINDVPFK
jgi:hypothetical protein